MNEYPLHFSAFNNDFNRLKELLSIDKSHINDRDLRGKTPLELAIILNNYESARVLIENGADCTLLTKQGWNYIQEAVSTMNPQLVRLLIQNRDYQRTSSRNNGIPELLNRLKQAPDFYVEMKWEFTSWVPLVSKACPSDVYKIYKSGSNVRIDTTLVGFNGSSWQRGNKSFLFQATEQGASLVEIDHITQKAMCDHLQLTPMVASNVNERIIDAKLASPNMTTYLDIEKIEFERNQSGFLGWRSEKIEQIDGYDCKAYKANNLQLITRTRVEHLDSREAVLNEDSDEDDDTKNANNSNKGLTSFLTNIFSGNEQKLKSEQLNEKLKSDQYFSKHVQIPEYLGRKIDESKRVQTFNATLSLCENYPISLHEQILPIVELMALNNSHFKKLKEFITLQLPSGFPIKIEIPLYRVITAKVTFGNVNASTNPIDRVTCAKDSRGKPISVCKVDESVFVIPPGYRSIGDYTSSHEYTSNRVEDEDDILLQLAIQQSLSTVQHSDQEQVSAMEMFGATQSNYARRSRNNSMNNFTSDGVYEEDSDKVLDRVLAESLASTNASRQLPLNYTSQMSSTYHQVDLAAILEISRREQQEREEQLRREEEELQRVLELSLVEK